MMLLTSLFIVLLVTVLNHKISLILTLQNFAAAILHLLKMVDGSLPNLTLLKHRLVGVTVHINYSLVNICI